ncbi:MAG TPA: BtpA/SgcQ family protein [Planctomycetaceae bacterium]|nr:BtpA/SgcQ family protein [Planctomycetaceae bacterium]
MSSLLTEWSHLTHPIIGMIHAAPLPGSPRYDGHWQRAIDLAVVDAKSLTEGGCDGLMIENFGDTPFYPGRVPAVTVAAMTRLAAEVRWVTALPLGINVLRNDGQSALAVAVAVGAQFIRVNVLCGARVTDQGLVSGIAHDLLRERSQLNAQHIRILADVDVKHSAPLGPRSLIDETHDLVERGGADAVIVSGSATGQPTSLADSQTILSAAGDKPVLIGSGATSERVPALKPHCNGFIVGTHFKRDGLVSAPVDVARVRAFVRAVRA